MVAYENQKRETEEVVLKVKRFKVNGAPTCASWFGIDNKHPREICRFLMVKKFGFAYSCGLLGVDLLHYAGIDTVLKPDDKCPIWNP